MENAADALKLGAAVLAFVLALAVGINAFGQARRTTQIIVEAKDREFDYTYVGTEKDESGKILTERIVSAETIIPTIMKTYNERYKICFYNSDGTPFEVYKVDGESKNYIEMEETLSGDNQKVKFLRFILFGDKRGIETEGGAAIFNNNKYNVANNRIL